MKYRLLGSILWMLLFVACQSVLKNKENESLLYTIDTINYAQGFQVSSSDEKIRIKVSNPWQHAKDIHLEYLLSPYDSLLNSITIPVERAVCFSTTHLAFIHLLGEDSSVVGVTNPKLISNQTIVQQIESGITLDIGNEQALNYELILSLKPDVIFAYGVGAEVQGIYQKFTEWGIPVVMVSEYLEDSPLAKTEWLKFFGLFYNKKDLADSLFTTIELQYNELLSKVSKIEKKPLVMSSLPWKDVWYVPGGNSFMAQFISDAGGNYLWKEDTSRESLALSMESVFFNSKKAEIWIHTGMANSLDEIKQTDPRMGQLKPFIDGTVYNNNNRISSNTMGNDFWESGVVNPQLILSDLINIFHPGIIADTNMYYYKKLK